MSATLSAPGYGAVLSAPRARPVFIASLVGRLSYSTISLALLFAVQQATNSYVAAGAASAAFGAATAVVAPARARLIDRCGPRLGLTVLAASYILFLGLLTVGCSTHGTPAPVLVILAVTAGLFPPPLGPIMRGLWAQMFPDPEMRQRAYSLDSVVEQVLYTIGPLLSGLLVTLASPAWALSSTMLLLALGATGMAASPLCRSWDPSSSDPRTRAATKPLRQPGFRPLLLVLVCLGTALGILDLGVVAFTQKHGAPATAGLLLGLLSLGSVLGGLFYGHRSWRRSPATRLMFITAPMSAVIAALAAAPNPVALGVGLLVTGVFLSPAFITGYLLADQLTPRDSRTEASTWVNTANNGGAAAGTAIAGLLVDHAGGTSTAFLVGGGVLMLGAGISAIQRQQLRSRQVERDLIPGPFAT